MDPHALIRHLGLQPHPEGGAYIETFRDAVASGGRAHSTAIYFLLQAGEVSRWHRIDAVELWHFYAGAPLELLLSIGARPRQRLVLGVDFAAGERPQHAVPAHVWQTAKSLGAWTLVGCTVAPGFSFEHFELAVDGWEPT